MKSGIYAIICREEWVIYIGSAENIPTRWTQHKVEFRKGGHVSQKMQKAWNRQGEEGIEFVVLEYVCLHEILRVEMLNILAARSIEHLTVSNQNKSWSKPIKVSGKPVTSRVYPIEALFKSELLTA
ncbi:MAG: GIY-YIG nuclease family protein [Bacteroidota bacterium]